ncbi:MAG TPA: DUF445 family protein [Gammaproteobacteria bacterium]|nr:DUF445 family protein [Gammaproteobacteria bacterium]
MKTTADFTINKSLLTNLIAVGFIVFSYFTVTFSLQFFDVGLFALSGALTNWLAVYMLFERIPLLYGSGVIPNQFEQFKSAIKTMMMEQFFTRENLGRLIEAEEDSASNLIDLESVLDEIDYDRVFQRLLDAIMESSFGSMLGMFGGSRALEPLREPFAKKIRGSLSEMVNSESFHQKLSSSLNTSALGEDMLEHIEQMVDYRLDELTPEMVKEIVQKMIQQHLGWLVVWGGVFGGLIGLLVSLLQDA